MYDDFDGVAALVARGLKHGEIAAALVLRSIRGRARAQPAGYGGPGLADAGRAPDEQAEP
jgi:hypothetical protein